MMLSGDCDEVDAQRPASVGGTSKEGRGAVYDERRQGRAQCADSYS
jgi:hypothetical protein